MIQLNRPATPASLTMPEIRQYVVDCAQYAADCAAAADPTIVPEPTKPGSYRNSDLLAAFDEHFYSKCYLTEQWHGSSWEMDIDHFVPYNQNPALRYDWDNLFPAAHKANMMRPRTLPPGGLLNPCTDLVAQELTATIGINGQSPFFEATNSGNRAAENTADLLNLLHNGRFNNPDSQENTKHLRVTIAKQYDLVLHAILAYQQAQTTGNNLQQKANTTRVLRDLLSRKAPFTMLMRAMIAVVEYVPTDLLD